MTGFCPSYLSSKISGDNAVALPGRRFRHLSTNPSDKLKKLNSFCEGSSHADRKIVSQSLRRTPRAACKLQWLLKGASRRVSDTQYGRSPGRFAISSLGIVVPNKTSQKRPCLP